MGFPIRKSTDQRVFAPPRSLSQRITSFIACACQGIHQLPLRHLIVLIANAHRRRLRSTNVIGTKRPASRDLSRGAVRQTHHLREIERLTATNHNRQRVHQQKAKPLGATLGAWSPNKSSLYDVKQNRQQARRLPQILCANDFFILSTAKPPKETWWSRTGSNRRHPACKAGALPAELRPLIPVERKGMVGLGGLEPPTSRLSSARSNQLSYKP